MGYDAEGVLVVGWEVEFDNLAAWVASRMGMRHIPNEGHVLRDNGEIVCTAGELLEDVLRVNRFGVRGNRYGTNPLNICGLRVIGVSVQYDCPPQYKRYFVQLLLRGDDAMPLLAEYADIAAVVSNTELVEKARCLAREIERRPVPELPGVLAVSHIW
jgi:hypothetical protein